MVTQAEIDAVPWRKTEYIAPHEYILVMDYPDLVEKITKHIKEEGITQEFRGVKYRYFYFGGYRYWRMGVVLNRAIAKNDQGLRWIQQHLWHQTERHLASRRSHPCMHMDTLHACMGCMK